MSNEELIKAIELYQNDSNVHPLTCGDDSTHEPTLVPREENGEVILVCRVCGYKQKYIPMCVIDYYQSKINISKMSDSEYFNFLKREKIGKSPKQITSFRGEYSFLSNFHSVNIIYNGIEYPSVEHAYQAQKTLKDDIREKISLMTTAGEAKEYIKNIKIREDWESKKIIIMKDLLFLKFSEEPLRSKLLETGDSELIEGNVWGDTFWGICNGQGSNMLGVLLTYVRHCLKCRL
jgi:ribA/ribD-fused uncharacterized protein